MGRSGKCDFSEFEKFAKQFEKVSEAQIHEFCKSCAKELAARLLSLVIKRTPVGHYPKDFGKKGGTLRRGWTAKTEEEAMSSTGKPSAPEQKAFIEGCTVSKSGSTYSIEITNPVHYASYVEFGHRTLKISPKTGKVIRYKGKDGKWYTGKDGWANGKYMLTISESTLKQQAPAILEKKIEKWLGEVLS